MHLPTLRHLDPHKVLPHRLDISTRRLPDPLRSMQRLPDLLRWTEALIQARGTTISTVKFNIHHRMSSLLLFPLSDAILASNIILPTVPHALSQLNVILSLV